MNGIFNPLVYRIFLTASAATSALHDLNIGQVSNSLLVTLSGNYELQVDELPQSIDSQFCTYVLNDEADDLRNLLEALSLILFKKLLVDELPIDALDAKPFAFSQATLLDITPPFNVVK